MRTQNDPDTSPTRSPVLLRTRVWRGLLWGWSVAGIFIVLATIIGALLPPDERWLAALIIVTYWIAASIAGVVLGVLAPYVRGWARRVLMGFLLATIMFSGAAVAVERRTPTPAEILVILVLSAVGGPLFAVFHEVLRRLSPELNGWPLGDHWP